MSRRGLGALARLVERNADGRTATIDRSVLADLDAARRGLDLPEGLELTWLGTAGFRLHMDGTTLLVDPFVSRRSLPQTLGARAFLSDTALVDRLLPEADAVLVGHCHFDHAVDVPHLAARGATVYGSRSVQALLALHGLGARAVEVDPSATYEIGPFTVRFAPSRHSKLVLGLAVPSDGELTCDSLDDLGSSAYRCGQVWAIHIEVAGTTILHQGSAELDGRHYALRMSTTAVDANGATQLSAFVRPTSGAFSLAAEGILTTAGTPEFVGALTYRQVPRGGATELEIAARGDLVLTGKGEGYTGEQTGTVIAVAASAQPKCSRCWTHDRSVGENTMHPELCSRCAEVIST